MRTSSTLLCRQRIQRASMCREGQLKLRLLVFLYFHRISRSLVLGQPKKSSLLHIFIITVTSPIISLFRAWSIIACTKKKGIGVRLIPQGRGGALPLAPSVTALLGTDKTAEQILNWVFASDSHFLIPLFLNPNVVWPLDLRILLDQMIKVWNTPAGCKDKVIESNISIVTNFRREARSAHKAKTRFI